jgi:hypothetical protein
LELSKAKEEKTTIKYVYNKADDHKTIYANGIVGSWTGRGEVLCSFYLEHLPTIPPNEEYEITADGKVGKLLSRQSPTAGSVDRDMKVTIILKVDDAEVIANWILGAVKAARAARGGKT